MYEMSDNENNKSPDKMKNVKQSSTKRDKKIRSEDSLESMNATLSTPEYVTNDGKTITSNTAPVASSSKTDDTEIVTTNNKRRKSKMNDSLSKHWKASTETRQSFVNMKKVMSNVFKYLNTYELLKASRVCSAWNLIAMNKDLWHTVRLKNSMVYDWNGAIAFFQNHRTVTLDTRNMIIPIKIEDFHMFWSQFSIAIKKAQQLKSIELFRCPTNVVEDIIYSLPQLLVLNATSLKNPMKFNEGENPYIHMTLNLHSLSTLEHLTELRIKSLTGIRLTNLPSFENLVNLKYLSLTSLKEFPNDICQSLKTLSTNLAFLEIGDCDDLSNDLAGVLKRLTNLTLLRLENCGEKFTNDAQEIFCAIRSLNRLKILELINIEFSNSVEDELEKCDGIKALLIIPMYIKQSATTNCHIFDCLKKLSNTLTHLIWGLTIELTRLTDLFITNYSQLNQNISYNFEILHIPILKTRRPKQQSGEEPNSDQDKCDFQPNNVDVLSIPDVEKLLETMMPFAKTKVVVVPFASTTQVYILDYFKDLN